MKGIKFRRNTKDSLGYIREGEVVYATDAQEWGLGLGNGVTEWRKHELAHNYWIDGEGNPAFDIGEIGDYYFDLLTGTFYRKEDNFGWKTVGFPVSREYIDNTYIRKGEDPSFDDFSVVLRSDGSVSKPVNFVNNEMTVVTKKEADKELGFLSTDGGRYFDEDYIGIDDAQVIVYGQPLYVNFPKQDPFVEGCVWNDNGTLKISVPPGHIRYFTTQPLTFSDGITRNPTNGYIDIIGDDEIFLDYYYGQENVTKIQVLRYGNRTSWKQIAFECRNLVEFEVLATDKSYVNNFSDAWNFCSSLTSFPQVDVSNGTDFSYAWSNCSSLTSFPVLDVSNGTNFTSGWYNCNKLPHCPGGNEITIPSGAITTDMCTGTCCAG